MFKELRYRTLVTVTGGVLILAVCLSCFGLNQQGSKRARAGRKPTNTQLVVLVTASRSVVKLPPRTVVDVSSLACELTENQVRLSAIAATAHNRYVYFTWQVPVGRLIGKGREVTWDLSGVQEGTYTATVEVSTRNNKHSVRDSTTVTVLICRHGKSLLTFLVSAANL